MDGRPAGDGGATRHRPCMHVKACSPLLVIPLLQTFQPRPILFKGKAKVLPYLTMFWMARHSPLIPSTSPHLSPPAHPLWPENASTHQLQALSITPLPGHPEARPPSSSFFSSRSPRSALGEAFRDPTEEVEHLGRWVSEGFTKS